MTNNQFAVLCNEYLIHPAIALESELIKEALTCRDDKEVKRILEEEF